MDSPALSMHYWRENKKKELASRVEATRKQEFLESLTASGISIFSLEHYDAQLSRSPKTVKCESGCCEVHFS